MAFLATHGDEVVSRIRTREQIGPDNYIQFMAQFRMITITNPLISPVISMAIGSDESIIKNGIDHPKINQDFKQFAEHSGIKSNVLYKRKDGTLKSDIARFGAAIRGSDALNVMAKTLVQEPMKNVWSQKRNKALVEIE